MSDDASRVHSGKIYIDRESSDQKARRVYKVCVGIIEAEQNEERKIQENMAKYGVPSGRGKYLNEGLVARLSGISMLDLNKLTPYDLKGFWGGYYETGNEQISRICSDEKILERSEKFIKKACKDEKIDDINIEDLLYNMGMRDAKDQNIIFDELPKSMQNNKYYVEGFEQGLHETYKKGR